jgi:TonB family protein
MRTIGVLLAAVLSTVPLAAQRGAALDQIRRTAVDIRMLGAAIAAYAAEYDTYPAARSAAELKVFISPLFNGDVPQYDAWGKPIVYIVSPNGRQFLLLSGGADRLIEPEHLQFSDPNVHMTRELDDDTGDIVFQNGAFLAAPASLRALVQRPVAPAAPVPARSVPPGYIRMGSGVRAPELVMRVEPVYSDQARQAGISGIVILEVLVDAAGNVADAWVLKPLPYGLDQAALQAVRQWKFKPATKEGSPVPVVFTVSVNFKLDEAAEP